MTRQPRTRVQYLQLVATTVVGMIIVATVARITWLVWAPLF